MVLLASVLVALAGTLTELFSGRIEDNFSDSAGLRRNGDVRPGIAALTNDRYAYKFRR